MALVLIIFGVWTVGQNHRPPHENDATPAHGLIHLPTPRGPGVVNACTARARTGRVANSWLGMAVTRRALKRPGFAWRETRKPRRFGATYDRRPSDGVAATYARQQPATSCTAARCRDCYSMPASRCRART